MYPLLSQTADPQADYSAFTTEVFIPFDHSDLNTAVSFTEDVRTSIRFGTGSYTYHSIIDSEYSPSRSFFFQVVSGAVRHDPLLSHAPLHFHGIAQAIWTIRIKNLSPSSTSKCLILPNLS